MAQAKDSVDLLALMTDGMKSAQAVLEQMSNQLSGLNSAETGVDELWKAGTEYWRILNAQTGACAPGSAADDTAEQGLSDILSRLRLAHLEWSQSRLSSYSELLSRHATFVSTTLAATGATDGDPRSLEHKRRTLIDEANLYLDDVLAISKREMATFEAQVSELSEQLRALADGGAQRSSPKRNVRAKE